MKITYRRLFQFNTVAIDVMKNMPDTKLAWAIKKITKKTDIQAEQFNELVAEAEINNCEVDEKSRIIRDSNKDLIFTKDGFKAMKKEKKEAMDATLEIEPYFATEFPKELTQDQIEILTGFAIPEKVEAPKLEVSKDTE